MSIRLARLFGSTPAQRRTRAGLLMAAVVAVPLAVAGVVSGAFGATGAQKDALSHIPAVVVNDDTMITTTRPDGTKQPVLAGRLLVTKLTAPGEATGFDWTVSNDAEAADKLANGQAYAVLTIPKDFSSSVTSLSGAHPVKASLAIRTDDAHGYLAGSVAQAVGDAMTAAFGRSITSQYLEGLYSNLGAFGGAFGHAADGASKLASGADSMTTGLGELSSGTAQSASGAHGAASGAHAYADGVAQYTGGVDRLAAGLGRLQTGAAGLDGISAGVRKYTAGVSDLSANYATLQPRVVALIDQSIPGGAATCATSPLPAQLAELCKLRAGVIGVGEGASTLAVHGADLSAGTSTAIAGTQGGIAQSTDGAAKLADGSAQLRDGAAGLASGLDQLASGLDRLSAGASGAASGSAQLATGAHSLADGLSKGADQAKAITDLDPKTTAAVVSEPVQVTATRAHEIGSTGEVIGMLFAPIGLWLGAMALFLVFRPFGREALRSTTSTAGLVLRTLGRAALVALAQAVAVVALLHLALGVSWTLLPQTLAFSALLALVFTALHGFLMTWLGRGGIIVSLVLVTLQLAASGGLYPVEILSGPYQAVSPYLPLTWAVQGMQAIVSGAGGGAVWAAAAVLAVFGLIGVVGAGLAVGRRRGIRSIGFASAALG